MVAFCVNCNDKTEYSISERKGVLCTYHKGRADERTFHYAELYAVCSACGAEVYVPEINDENCNRREHKLNKR